MFSGCPLSYVFDCVAPPSEFVHLLTSEDRNVWADARAEMIEYSSANSTNLDTIDSAL